MPRRQVSGRANRSRRVRESRPVRPKVDSRLSLLLSLRRDQLRRLHEQEQQQLGRLSEELRATLAALDQEPEDAARSAHAARLRELDDSLFAPITAGLYWPRAAGEERAWPLDLAEPYVSAFILSDAGAGDLNRLGARVRGQAGDVFTAFVPLSRIPRLEASPAVRFIELARPVFPTLDQAVPYAQLDTLHTALPPITGAGVIVGISDIILDIYHPDFRTAAGATRVLFLWDQTLTPQAGEAGPPTDPLLPGFMPVGGATYGVEYDQAAINTELTNFNPPAVPAYQTVRHGGVAATHGTHVAGIAAGNGLGKAGKFTGAAPGADIIFVSHPDLNGGPLATAALADLALVADGFAYIFARASLLGRPCVVNLSDSDNQGPHDGSLLGEQFLDNLLATPGRAITLAAGNANKRASHATGTVALGATTNLVLSYAAGAAQSDDVELWYDRQDRFNVTLTVPSVPATVIGPVAPGASASASLPNGATVQVTSVLHDPRNGDNLISIIMTLPVGQTLPAGNWKIALAGTAVINGRFQAWVDRNNRPKSAWQAAFRQEDQLTLGVPATARRPITVGNHDVSGPPPAIQSNSGHGPTRDGRIKPEIASVGIIASTPSVLGVQAPRSRDMNAAAPGALYTGMAGTSMSAPLVAGACALLFQCRGGMPTWASLKQILEDTAGTAGLMPAAPNPAFGFGYMQMKTACARPLLDVDVWLKDDAADTGAEPFTAPVAWLSPDIEVLDAAGSPVTNPTYNPANRFNNIIRVTLRNRGTQTARNTEVYLYWADPATNIPYPAAWNTGGIFTGSPQFLTGGNRIVVPRLAAGASTQVEFGWAPPAPGGNLRGDDHFCLLVRLENEGDPSQVGAGGWTSIVARNNVGLRNVHVQPAGGGDAVMSFYVVGSSDQDGLLVMPDLAGGRVALAVPIQSLPWRELRLLGQPGRRSPYGGNEPADPLLGVRRSLQGDQVRRLTGITGAAALELRDGVATAWLAAGERLFVPDARLAEGVRMPANIRVQDARIVAGRGFVHVAQLSGGQLIGGVSLELRAIAAS